MPRMSIVHMYICLHKDTDLPVAAVIDRSLADRRVPKTRHIIKSRAFDSVTNVVRRTKDKKKIYNIHTKDKKVII